MDEISHIPHYVLHLPFRDLVFNSQTIIMTWIVMAVLIIFGFLATRKIGILPNPFQVMGELIVSLFMRIVTDALGEKMAKKYFPLICALFMFLVMSNWIGIIPRFAEPTKDLNTPLSLGLMGFVLSHYCGIRAKGIKAYLKGYIDPIFFMLPLNIIGELAKVISISFRLFGNIMGGAIIIIVVSHLVYSLILPPILNCFFGIFVGTVQAFVFTMLTLVYISVQVN